MTVRGADVGDSGCWCEDHYLIQSWYGMDVNLTQKVGVKEVKKVKLSP
jgi:hypothetical protein